MFKAGVVFLVNVLSLGLTEAKSQTAPVAIIKVKDLVPKFLHFYEDATRSILSESDRWKLWKKEYDFAAVPPTPGGDSIARKLLDSAWSRYPGLVSELKKGRSADTLNVNNVLERVMQQLKPDKSVALTLLSYVGGYEYNAFTVAEKGSITVAIPREWPGLTRELLMTHEFTHAVHISMGSVQGGYIRTIAAIVVSEGLATRVTQSLFKSLPNASFIEAKPGWLVEGKTHQKEILKDIEPLLGSSRPRDIMDFTMGHRASGFEREAYYTGWVVVKYWLSNGESFASIARIPEKDMPLRVSQAIHALLKI